MKAVFDLGHPGDVHFFKHVMWSLEERGWETLAAVRQRDVVIDLLESNDIDYAIIGGRAEGIVGKAKEMVNIEKNLYRLAKKNDVDALVGETPYAAHVGWLLRKPSFILVSNDHAVFENLIFAPFATRVFSSETLRWNFGRRHVRFKGLSLGAFLLPKYFSPDSGVLKSLKQPYSIIRIVEWGALHDSTGRVMHNPEKLVKKMREYGKVYYTIEKSHHSDAERKKMEDWGAEPFLLHPSKLVDAIAFSEMYVGDGGSMAVEAAYLGTPSIFVSSIPVTYIQWLQDEFDIVRHARNEDEALKEISALSGKKKVWQDKREDLLSSLEDFVGRTVELVDSVSRKRGAQ